MISEEDTDGVYSDATVLFAIKISEIGAEMLQTKEVTQSAYTETFYIK